MRIVVAALVAVVAGPALAFEPTGNLVADAMLRTMEEAGYANPRADVERVADSVILRNVSAAGGALTAESIAVDRGSIDADNALNAAAITYSSVRVRGDGMAASAADAIVLRTVRLPSGLAQTGLNRLLGTFERLSLRGVEARSEAGEAITLTALSMGAQLAEGTTRATIAVDDLVFDLGLFEEPAASQIRALGYDRLVVDLSADGQWQDGGDASLSAAALSLEGMGTLRLSGAAVGLTTRSLNTLRASSAEFSEVLEVLGSISLSTLTVSFEDDGLTEKLLNAAASRTGQSPQVVAATLVSAAEPLLQSVGDAAFATRVRAAITGFLAEPGRLTVTATPAQEVTALQVIGAAMLNPTLIPDLLSLTIERE